MCIRSDPEPIHAICGKRRCSGVAVRGSMPAVVTETMFSWPGVGRLAVGAIVSSDFPTAQGAIMILAVAFLMINLIVDVLYVYLDPRVQRG